MKNFKNYIREYNEIDPYGEEQWEDNIFIFVKNNTETFEVLIVHGYIERLAFGYRLLDTNGNTIGGANAYIPIKSKKEFFENKWKNSMSSQFIIGIDYDIKDLDLNSFSKKVYEHMKKKYLKRLQNKIDDYKQLIEFMKDENNIIRHV